MELAISFDLLLEIVYRLIGKGLGGVGWKMKVPWCECILALFFTRPSVFNPCNLAACCRMSIGYKQWGWIYFFSELLLFLKKAEALKLGSVRWQMASQSLRLGLCWRKLWFYLLNQSIGGFCCTWNRPKLLMSFPGLIHARIWSRKSFEDVRKTICLTWATWGYFYYELLF